MKRFNRQIVKYRSEKNISDKSIFSSFKTPIKGILDILLIMTIITLAIVYLGPIAIGDLTEVDDKNENYRLNSEYYCTDTGRLIKDYLIDEHGEKYGWIDVEYHDEGRLMRITEHNQRDRTEIRAYYNEDNEILHWYEIKYDERGNEVSSEKYGADGSRIMNNY